MINEVTDLCDATAVALHLLLVMDLVEQVTHPAVHLRDDRVLTVVNLEQVDVV